MTSRRIFLVEDEPLIASGIERKIEQLGYEFAGSAGSGEAAIRTIDADPPDLILMDIKLEGGLDGIETAARIHDKHEIPVIFLTAYADEATLDRATKEDPFAYIVKPFTDRELFGAIEVAMHRHELHRSLQMSKERYRMLSELTSDYAFSVILRRDSEQESIEWSIGDLEQVMGVKGALPLEDMLYLVHPEDVGRVRELWRRIRHGEGGAIEFRIVRDADSIAWIKFDARVQPLGELSRLYGSLQDITALREAESRLERREFEFSQIVQSMRQGIWVGDAENVCIYANQALSQMTGYSREEIVGKDSLSTVVGLTDRVTDGPDEPREIQLRRKDRQEITVLVTPREILDSQGSRRGSFNLIVDVTRQRRAMEALRRTQRKLEGVFHESPAASLLIDAATNAVLDVNRAFTDLTGFDRDQIVGSGGFGLAAYEDLDDLNRMVALLKTRVPTADSIRLRTRDGGSVLLKMEVRSIAADDEELLLLILTAS